MGCDCQDISGIRAVYFQGKDGSVLTPFQVNAILYAPLSDLSGYNHFCNVTNTKYPRQQSLPLTEQIRTKTALHAKARQEIAEITGLTTRIFYEDGSNEDFQVKPRTNYDIQLTKRPNIIHLVGRDGREYVLRESRPYQRDEVELLGKGHHGDHYKPEIDSRQLASKPTLRKNDVVLFPEPDLVLALEQVCGSLEEGGLGVTRITPHIKLLGTQGGHIASLRRYLPGLKDSSVSIQTLTAYIGTLHGLNLLDSIDTQVAHYCANSDGIVVNIDPDLWAFSQNPHHSQCDMHTFRSTVMASLIGTPLPDARKEISDHKSAATELARGRLQGKTLLDFLHPELKDYPAVQRLKVDNFDAS